MGVDQIVQLLKNQNLAERKKTETHLKTGLNAMPG